MKVESGSVIVDGEEVVGWIMEQAERLGEPIRAATVRRVVVLFLGFEFLLRNELMRDHSLDDPSIPHIGDEVNGI